MTEIQILKEYHIPYIIKEKDIKALRIRYDSKGNLIISKPKRLSINKTAEFIERNINWIIKHKPVYYLAHNTYVSGDSYLLLGEVLTLNLVHSYHEEVIKQDKTLFVYFTDLNNIRELLNNYRYKIAETVFNETLYNCYKKMEFELNKYPNLIIKKSKSKWGCCYTKQNKIMLNIALINTSFELIEYVIFHELTHFIVPNHSKLFHDKLNIYLSQENLYRKKLKNYCVEYE